MRIIVGCESSRRVSREFEKLGHYVLSCDLLPPDVPGNHYQGDIFDVLYDGWDMLIAFPPCTYLCSSGLHWNTVIPERSQKTEKALEFVKRLMAAPIDKIGIENPVGCISTRIRPASQYIQPYDFGEDASKKTGLWLKNLPLLKPTKRIPGRIVNGIERWSNQTDSGQNRVAPSADRWKERSLTYIGIASAMAHQWGVFQPIQTELDI